MNTTPLAQAPETDFRVDLYLWLSRVFATEQTAETLAGYCTPEGRAVLIRLAAMPVFAEGAERLLAMSATWTDLSDTSLDLAAAFARLFLGAGGRTGSVPPYESVFTSEQATLYQETTADMERLLKAHGLSASAWNEPADHIAVELEFLAHLTALAVNGNADAEARRRAVLSDHLLVWAWEFSEMCIERDRSGFYAAAAQILKGLLASEEEALAPA